MNLMESPDWLANEVSDIPPEQRIVGVVGAGIMGAGIVQVAAAAGHPVRLMDVRPGAAASAVEKIGTTLDGLVRKERMTVQERDALMARITPVDQLAELSEAALIVEVIVEQLQAKQSLLREIEALVSRHAIIASNTSSISITALANGMQYPDRVVGMHFFNPVPLMRLVEVISGAETATGVAQNVFDTARLWGKTPVLAKSTPGFIVNRIARPFYAEALALLQEQAGTPAELDCLARSAGFRMGPCELMDLIGHDTNYSVTQSVFEANFGDRRYVPSLIQKALVDGGRLGRKVGKGFYEGTPAPVPDLAAGPLPAVEVAGNGCAAQRLADWLHTADVPFSTSANENWIGLRIGETELHVTDGRTAIQLAAQLGRQHIATIDLPLLADAGGAIGIAFAGCMPAEARHAAMAALAACRLKPVEMRDVPGLLVARTIAMLINEGADAVHQGVCDEHGADIAMKLGTNYPAGPFEWLAQIGVAHTVTILNHLFDAYRSERYRVSPLLQQRFWLERSALCMRNAEGVKI